MIDDPLALIVQGIAVLAAGMYPVGVGYMFGVCSACCDDCPEECNKCNHFYNGTGCQSVESYSVTIAGYGTLATNQINDFETADCLDGVEPELQLTNNYAPACTGGSLVTVTARLRFDVPDGQDECLCQTKVLQPLILFRFVVEGGGDPETIEAQLDGDVFLSCEAGTFPLSFLAITANDVVGACANDFEEFVEGLGISGEYTRAGCDCGACCDDGCEENVAEGGCVSWQGVGVGCDPDPCE